MYTSGIFFVWPEVPYSMRPIAIYNPFFHLEELMHAAYFEVYHSPIASWNYVITIQVLTLALGLVVERRCRPLRGHGTRPEGEDPYAVVDSF
jgi:ABC-type polysaccharide/polyol phosphate export permease